MLPNRFCLRPKLFSTNCQYTCGEIIKETYHPNAYLKRKKNVKAGLKARTKILGLLEEQAIAAGTVSAGTSLTYGSTMHHLRLLENDGTVVRKGNKPFLWISTGIGQKRLVS